MTDHQTSQFQPARIVAPTAPTPAPKRGFPVFATAAPVVMSLVMWLVTQSIYALLFAVLGPLVAVASIVDNRVSSDRAFRVELRRFSDELATAKDDISREHERERRAIARAVPSAARLVAATGPNAVRWGDGTPDRLDVTLGRGERASGLLVDFSTPVRSAADSVSAQLERLRSDAATLLDAQICVDARQGIAVYGPQFSAEAIVRALLVQLAAALSPAEYELVLGIGALDEDWMADIPHRVERDKSRDIRFRPIGSASAGIVLAISRGQADLPATVAAVVHATGLAGELTIGGTTISLALDQLSERQAALWATRARQLAEQERHVSGSHSIPTSVSFATLAQGSRQPGGRGTLACSFAVGTAGNEIVDLVAEGPHAIVGGTTGSGKSELLIAWVLSMAQRYSPEQVSFLLFDFKGGSTFAELSSLRHCVGMISDLDMRSAERALASLSAELRNREQILRELAVRTIDDLPSLNAFPRLVIVVDEFAAMASDYPELNSLFADLAARGRSLGIHLILCTQRPAGAIRETVLANSALRFSLRVNSKADSVAVIGTDDAASLPAEPRGRGLLSRSSGAPVAVQAAMAESRDISAIVASWADFPYLPRRPWLEPLPPVIDRETIAAHATTSCIPIGRSDAPNEQSQPVALYCPAEHGHLLVVGGSRSGKTSFLNTIAASAPTFPVISVPEDLEGAWDTLHAIAAAGANAPHDGVRLVLIDNLDATIARFSDDYQSAFIELIARLLRESSHLGIHVVMTAQRIIPSLQPIAALCESRLILRMWSRQEHMLAGGNGVEFASDLRPGETVWRGLRSQLARVTVPAKAPPRTSETAFFEPLGTVLVVSAQPQSMAQRIRTLPAFAGETDAVFELESSRESDPRELSRSRPGRTVAFVADADTWQFHFGAMANFKGRCSVLFDRCTVTEFRSVSRLRILPPPLEDPTRSFWLLAIDGSVGRVLWPIVEQAAR